MKFLFKILNIFIGIFVLFVFLIFLNGFYIYKNVTNEISVENKVKSITNKEDYVDIEKISKYVGEYMVGVEDSRFYIHNGIDIISIFASLVSNINAGYYKYGGSTITQQLAKNLYFTNEKSLTRKIAEMFVSFEIERNYEKDKILELYLNVIYFGNNYYGIKDASLGYFNVLPSELTDYQASLIVGIPQAPSLYNLTNKDSMMKRYSNVLKILINNNKIDEDKAKEFFEFYKAS